MIKENVRASCESNNSLVKLLGEESEDEKNMTKMSTRRPCGFLCHRWHFQGSPEILNALSLQKIDATVAVRIPKSVSKAGSEHREPEVRAGKVLLQIFKGVGEYFSEVTEGLGRQDC